jgi:hypothetical protein
MLPKVVAMLAESFFKEIMRKYARLQENIHALLYFDIDCTIIVGQVVEIVGFDEIRRGVADFHAHVYR